MKNTLLSLSLVLVGVVLLANVYQTNKKINTLTSEKQSCEFSLQETNSQLDEQRFYKQLKETDDLIMKGTAEYIQAMLDERWDALQYIDDKVSLLTEERTSILQKLDYCQGEEFCW